MRLGREEAPASSRFPAIESDPASVFQRSGLAALSDLETPLWRELFACLEREQDLFLAHESGFRSAEYLWLRALEQTEAAGSVRA